jgi:putative spermidine/putrescine transport system substrate-binding protein
MGCHAAQGGDVGTIPNDAKDASGNWYGDYHGVLASRSTGHRGTRRRTGRTLKPFKNLSRCGDPRTSNQAIQGVLAAGLAMTKGNMEGAAEAGLKFFADLNKAGNFVPVIGKVASLAQGATPIIIRWDYNALADRDTLKGNPKVAVVVPKSGVVAGVYVQAISAFAPHPNAAKLWMEHLYSDEGQIAWLKGYCHPIRFLDLVKNKKVPADLLAKLPPAESYDKAVFPTLDQQAKAKEIITKQWDTVVGANVK